MRREGMISAGGGKESKRGKERTVAAESDEETSSFSNAVRGN